MTTNRTTKTLTNGAAQRHGEPARTLTITRALGSGPLRTGDRVIVREGDIRHGSLTLIGRRGGMNVWSVRADGSPTSWTYTGDQASAAWSLAGDTAPTQN